MYDGTLKFDTAIDDSGFNIGIDNLGSIAKSGMNLISSAASAVLDVVSAVADKAVSLGTAVISTGKEFEQGMSQVAATLQYSVTDLKNSETEAYKNMEILTAKAEEMGATTAFTATQAAEGLNILAMSGYDAGESVSMISDVLNLASAGSLSLESAAGYLAVTMKGFQDEAQDSAYYADMIAKGATLAATNVDELGRAFSGSAANAAAYGQSSTETAVALLRLANQGVTAEEAVTNLKSVMSNIYAPSTQAAEIFEKIGFSAYDANGKAKDFNSAIDELGQAMHNYAGTDESIFSGMVNDIFGQRGQAAFNKLLASSEADVQKFYDGIAEAEGSAALQMETMLDNLEGKITIFNSALDGLKVKLYQSVQEPLKDLVEIGTGYLTGLTKAFQNSGFGGLATVLGNYLADAAEVIAGRIPEIAEIGFLFTNRLSESIVRNMPSLSENALQIGLILIEGIANGILNTGEIAVSLISSLSDGIQSHADDIRQTVEDILYRFSEFVSENIPILLDAGMQILSTLCDSILTEENIDLLLNAAGIILSSLVTALIEYLQLLISAAVQLIVFLCDSLITPENIELCRFEKPADTSESAKNKRYEYGQKYYSMFVSSSESEVMKMTKYGIDVSVHNGAVDWTKVKASGKVDFAILRAGYGKLISQKDKKFEEYYRACQENSIPVGAYWYSYALTEAEARQEAEVFLEVIQGKQFAYPVYFDLEEQNQFTLGKAKCSAIAEAFMSTIEKAGYFTGLYMSKSPLEMYMSDEIRKKYSIWVAHYGISKTDYSGQFGMWQKSSTGSISGISGNVDLDECYLDYPTIIRNAGLNGFSKSVEKPAESVETEQKKTMYANISADGKTYSGTLTEE